MEAFLRLEEILCHEFYEYDVKSTTEFELFLLTKEIALLSFASQFVMSDLDRFETLANQMIAKCQILQPDFEIYPKIHHMSHYGDIIKIFGPLYFYSTFRYFSCYFDSKINVVFKFLVMSESTNTAK